MLYFETRTLMYRVFLMYLVATIGDHQDPRDHKLEDDHEPRDDQDCLEDCICLERKSLNIVKKHVFICSNPYCQAQSQLQLGWVSFNFNSDHPPHPLEIRHARAN